jgi:predicted Rdx family selenoprotein
MITVAILINGQPIVARNAINRDNKNKKGETEYFTDSGEIVWHRRADGAVALAKKLLDTIRNDGPQKC